MVAKLTWRVMSFCTLLEGRPFCIMFIWPRGRGIDLLPRQGLLRVAGDVLHPPCAWLLGVQEVLEELHLQLRRGVCGNGEHIRSPLW